LRHGLGHLRYHRIVDAGFSAESLLFIGHPLATWLWYPMTARVAGDTVRSRWLSIKEMKQIPRYQVGGTCWKPIHYP
jgi:hypothetical protein